MSGVNPGSLASQMPARDDDMPRLIRDLRRALQQQASANTLQAAQFGKGGILVTDGGSITFSGTGALNTTGALTTSGSFSAATSISAGTTMSASGTITGGAFSTSGSISGGSCSITSGLSAGSVSVSGNIDSTAGRVYSAGAFVSPGSRGTVVVTGYVNAYLDGAGVVGYQPSSRKKKKDLAPIPPHLLAATLRLPTYMGRYKTEKSDAPMTPFLIADEVRDAGFGTSVVPEDENGEPIAINHQNLTPVLLELIKSQASEMATMKAEMVELKARLARAGY